MTRVQYRLTRLTPTTGMENKMGKGSKQRPTAQTFWDNWDRIFADKPDPDFKFVCYRCDTKLLEGEVVEYVEMNHEPFGDRLVERPVRIVKCARCGDEVEDIH